MKSPSLTDTKALARNRSRASAFFLHDDMIAEIKERLDEVNRAFKSPAIVTPFAHLWREAMPGATIVADDEVLGLAPGAHDLVIHALAMHWAQDPVGQMIQCRHALAPDGLFIAALFGGQTLHELRAVLAEAETAVTGGLSPRVLPMAEIRDLGALLQRAGFALPVADAVTRNVLYRDALHLMRDLRAMGEGNALSARLRRATSRRVFAEAASRYAAAFADGDRIRATFDVIYLTGWAPHDSQQKPLRPGTAEQRLAQSLGAVETILPAGKDET